MRKKLFVGAALLCSALLWGGESTVAQTVVSSYPYEENFDDTEAGGIPEGWVVEGTEGGGDYYVPFSVQPGLDYGKFPTTGDNVLVSGYPRLSNRVDVAFTPMMEMKAGVEYTVKVDVTMLSAGFPAPRIPSAKVTVGQSQSGDAHLTTLYSSESDLTEWENLELKFTPSADGQYCFGLWCSSTLGNVGDVMYDSFSVTAAETVEPEPEPVVISEYPYVENFDDTEAGGMPAGWLSVGDALFTVSPAIDWGAQAHSGDNLITAYSLEGNRSNVAFSPMMEMKAGYEYTMTVMVQRQDVAYKVPVSKVTVGASQDKSSHVIYYHEGTTATSGWEQIEVKYAPSSDGQYCFGLWDASVLSNPGSVFYDSFSVTEEKIEEPVEPTVITEFPYEENFDDTAIGELPEGWIAEGTEGGGDMYKPFSVQVGTDYMKFPTTGDNVLVSGYPQLSNRVDVAFTPMMEMKAGVEYTVKVDVTMLSAGFPAPRIPSAKVTVGQSQSGDAHLTTLYSSESDLTEWENLELKFTPSADGQYCFGLWCSSTLGNVGDVFYDSFSVTAAESEEPPVTWEATLPYEETFDDATHYSGEDYLPIGWLATGETPFVTANIDWKPAVSGEWYMVTSSSVYDTRRDIAYSPMFEMEAGKEYVASFYLFMPGGANNPSFKVTAGREQSSDMHTATLIEIKNETISDWTRYEAKFTPETAGEYCFAFWACSENVSDGYIAIDNVAIRAAEDVLPPAIWIKPGNMLNSLFTGSLLLKNQELKMVNRTEDADSYEWTVDGGAELSDATAAEPSIKFPASGTYDVTLEATNAGGTSSETVSVNINLNDGTEDTEDAIQTVSDITDYVFQQGDLPAYDENGAVVENGTYEVLYNYVVGVNPYYKAFAERFEIPADQEMTVNSLSAYIMMYYIFAESVGEVPVNDADANIKVVLYPEKDGKPDMANAFGSQTYNIRELFGDYGYYKPERRSIKFDEPIKVKGTFYVAFEFDQIHLEAGSGWQRSYIGADTRRHANLQTTLYVLPENAIEGTNFTPDGTYCRADEFCPALEGYSFTVMPWVTIHKLAEGSVEGIENDEVTISVSADGADYKVSGLADGARVQVWSVSGQLMFDGVSVDGEVVISASGWSKGVYVIAAGDNTVKVIK